MLRECLATIARITAEIGKVKDVAVIFLTTVFSSLKLHVECVLLLCD